MIIYKATNLINGKVYIGQTIRPLKARKWNHLTYYKNKRYCHLPFYRAIEKYGKNNFKWDVVDKAKTIEELNKKEEFWIKYYKSTNDKYGYNIKYGGKNKKLPDSVKRKISNAHKGKIKTEEHCKNISIGKKNKNIKLSYERKKQISKRLKGRIFTKEHSKNKSIAQTGEKNPYAKLKKEDVIKIKQMIKQGYQDTQIAKNYNCTYKNIWAIRHGITWKHVII